jgi:hypothetical protein
MSFAGFVIFPSSIWPSWAFLGFWSSSCAPWGFGLELQTLCFLLSMDSSRRRLRNQVVSTLVWLWWVINLLRFEFESRTFWWFYYLYPCSCGESRLHVSWCAGGRCDMIGSDGNRGMSRRPSTEDRGWPHRLDTRWPDGREVGWRCVWSVLCTWRRGAHVSWLSLKTKVDGLSVVWPQNHWYGLSVV